MNKRKTRILSVFLSITFLMSQPEFVYAFQNLAIWSNCDNALMSDIVLDIAAELKPGANGNGKPLKDLVSGKLPPQIRLGDDFREIILIRAREALDLAIELHIENREKIPAEYQKKEETTLQNLWSLQMALNKSLYFYNSKDTITGSEDYLLGFRFREQIGKDPLLIKKLDDKSLRLLAQDIYHDCIPEHIKLSENIKGIDREDHRGNYREIQTAIFGEKEVAQLKEFYREYIEATLFLSDEITEAIQVILDLDSLLPENENLPKKITLIDLMDKSSNEIVLTIVSGQTYIRAGKNSMVEQMEFCYLKNVTKDQDSSLVERVMAHSALYLKAKKNKALTKELREPLEFIAEKGSSFIARSIARQTLAGNEETGLGEILSNVQRQVLNKKSSKTDNISKTDKDKEILAIYPELEEYSYKDIPEEKLLILEVSGKIDGLINSIWTEVEKSEDLYTPFSDEMQKKMKKIVELDKFRIEKGIMLSHSACYPVCFSRLFAESNYQYIVKFMKDKTNLEYCRGSEESLKFRKYILTDSSYLSLYFISSLMNENCISSAEKEKKGIHNIALNELYGKDKWQGFFKKKNMEKEISAKMESSAGMIVFFLATYFKNGQYEKTLDLVNKQIRDKVNGMKIAVGYGHDTWIFAKSLLPLREMKQLVVEQRNNVSIVIACLKDILENDDFKEYHSKINTALTQIKSDTNQIRLDGYNDLLMLSDLLMSVYRQGKPILDWIYLEVSQLFEVLYAENYEIDITELGIAAFVLGQIAHIYREQGEIENNNEYDGKVMEIMLKLKEKAKTCHDNGLFLALSDILIEGALYKDAEEYIDRIENPIAKVDQLQNLAKIQVQNAKYLEALRIMEKAKEYAKTMFDFDDLSFIERRELAQIKEQTKDKIVREIRKIKETVESTTEENRWFADNPRLELTYRAELFKYSLIQWRKDHPEDVLVLAFDDDLGKDQKAQIMPLWKIVKAVKTMTDSQGKLLFPEDKFKAIRRSGSNGRLMREINSLLENEKVVKENIFLIGKKANIKQGRFDSIKEIAWITGIDDSGADNEVYLPVFEALTLTLMFASKADLMSLKRFYDKISDEPVSLEELQKVIRKKVIIYILPKMDRRNPKELRQLYEAEFGIYSAV
ncbi:MAG: hypothetical protein ABH869_03440 [Candidatus Omnitrophota bacterium]